MKTLWMLFYFMRRYPIYVFCFFMNELLLVLPSYVGNVLFLKYLMQALQDRENVSEMLLLLCETVLFLVAADVYTAWFSSRYKPCTEECIQKDFYDQIKNAAMRYGLEAYDDPAFYNDMTYINENICKDSPALLLYVSKMVAALINILLIVRLFYEMSFGVLLISFTAVGISFAFNMPIVRLQNNKKYIVNSIERKRRYFRDIFFYARDLS